MLKSLFRSTLRSTRAALAPKSSLAKGSTMKAGGTAQVASRKPQVHHSIHTTSPSNPTITTSPLTHRQELVTRDKIYEEKRFQVTQRIHDINNQKRQKAGEPDGWDHETDPMDPGRFGNREHANRHPNKPSSSHQQVNFTRKPGGTSTSQTRFSDMEPSHRARYGQPQVTAKDHAALHGANAAYASVSGWSGHSGLREH